MTEEMIDTALDAAYPNWRTRETDTRQKIREKYRRAISAVLGMLR